LGRKRVAASNATEPRPTRVDRFRYSSGVKLVLMAVKRALIVLPKSCTAAKQTTAIKATIIPYSTMVAPSSSRRNRLNSWRK
jgi:hypothetical protein